MKNIFETKCEALVVTVNCQGVMGKGIAKEASILYPGESRVYKNTCRQGYMTPGGVLVVDTYKDPKWIIFFATKDSWRNNSQLEWIVQGLDKLVEWVQELKISSVAIPPLGCGNGKLSWKEVKPLIEEKIKPLVNTGVKIEIYEPK